MKKTISLVLGSGDFHKAYDMIQVGRKAARQALRQKGMLD